jgi:hypothetical protein
MNTYYVSFGMNHRHYINGNTFTGKCIGKLLANNYDNAHNKAMNLFNAKFCTIYKEIPDMNLFPDGLINIKLEPKLGEI